ncbi:MAG: helix-turn-helix domain-containing protein [Bacillota bacterium]
MSIGIRLTELRKKTGLSQYEVAERLGIQRGRYNSWENDIAKPRTEMINKLAEFYEVNPDYLLGYVNHTMPEWATEKDKLDFKKMLESEEQVLFDGMPIEGEARQRVIDVLTGMFWEAKKNKKD